MGSFNQYLKNPYLLYKGGEGEIGKVDRNMPRPAKAG